MDYWIDYLYSINRSIIYTNLNLATSPHIQKSKNHKGFELSL